MNHTPKEMLDYTLSPRMGAGSVGKRGYLRLGFEIDQNNRSILRDLERRTPLIVQQELYFDSEWPTLPCVYILSSGGPTVDGDRYEQHFTLRRNAYAHISTGAATKLASMQHNFASMHQHITLDQGAYLEYLPLPTIPCSHTRYHSLTEVVIHPSATLIYGEVYLCGRKHSGERFDYDILSTTLRASRPDGEMLFQERLISEPCRVPPSRRGIMGEADVWASVVVITPEEHHPSLMEFSPSQSNLWCATTLLPSRCGVVCKILGSESGPVKQAEREFCSHARHLIKQRPLPAEFVWR